MELHTCTPPAALLRPYSAAIVARGHAPDTPHQASPEALTGVITPEATDLGADLSEPEAAVIIRTESATALLGPSLASPGLPGGQLLLQILPKEPS